MAGEHVEVDDRAFLAGFAAAVEGWKVDAIEFTVKTADRVVAIAEVDAPVRTGALKADIKAGPFVRTPTGGFVLITAGTREAFYQEFGTSKMPAHPFMRPALATVAGGLRSIGIAARLASTPAARAHLRRARQRQRVRRATLRVRRHPTTAAITALRQERSRLAALLREARQARRRRRRG